MERHAGRSPGPHPPRHRQTRYENARCCINLCGAGSVELTCLPTGAPDPAPAKPQGGRPLVTIPSDKVVTMILSDLARLSSRKCDGSVPVSFRKQGTA